MRALTDVEADVEADGLPVDDSVDRLGLPDAERADTGSAAVPPELTGAGRGRP